MSALIPGLIVVSKPLETYLIVREADGDRELTAGECRKLHAAADTHDDLVAALKRARDKLHRCIIFSGSSKETADACCEEFDAALAKAEGR